MNELRFSARWLAALLLLQMTIAPVANFALLDDAFGGEGGYLASAASQATELATAVLLAILLAVISAAIAIVLWPVLQPLSGRMAASLAILAAGVVSLAAFEGAALLSMLSLSQAYAAAGAPDDAFYQALRGAVGAHRNWAHLLQLLLGGGMLLAVYVSLFRFRLVPRWLAGFGTIAALSQMIAVTKPLFGGWVIFPMLAPVGIANLLLIGWLLWKREFASPRAATAGSGPLHTA